MKTVMPHQYHWNKCLPMDVSEVKGFAFGPWVGEQGHDGLDVSVSSPVSFTVTPWNRLRDSDTCRSLKMLCV